MAFSVHGHWINKGRLGIAGLGFFLVICKICPAWWWNVKSERTNWYLSITRLLMCSKIVDSPHPTTSTRWAATSYKYGVTTPLLGFKKPQLPFFFFGPFIGAIYPCHCIKKKRTARNRPNPLSPLSPLDASKWRPLVSTSPLPAVTWGVRCIYYHGKIFQMNIFFHWNLWQILEELGI